MTTRRFRLLFPAVVWLSTSSAWGATCNPSFQKLRDQLVSDGWDSTRIAMIFQDERLQFLPKLIPLNAVQREAPDIYQQFLTRTALRDGSAFLRENREEIRAILRGTGISPEIAVSILKIESDLGRKPGLHPILSSLATITLLGDSLHWLADYDTSGGVNLEAMEKRALRRSKWAYKEIRHFLQVCQREGWDPLEIKGSWAGAFGWAQFLPSSYLLFARDGDNDGKVNPYTLHDALASIAAFLKDAGWRTRPASQRRALMTYNPSTAYVDCILEYARRLKVLGGHPDIEAEDVGFSR